MVSVFPLLFFGCSAAFIGDEVLRTDVEVDGEDKIFNHMIFTKELTVAMWFKLEADFSSMAKMWATVNTESTPTDIVTLSQDTAGSFLSCYELGCKGLTINISKHSWHFISVMVNANQIEICAIAWDDTGGLGCNSQLIVVSQDTIFGKNYSLEAKPGTAKVKAIQMQFYKFEIYDTAKNSIEASDLIKRYCYSICATCNGPSPDACTNFLPFIDFQDSEEVPIEGRVFVASDKQYQDRSFSSPRSVTVTLWVNASILSSTNTINVIRLAYNE